MWCGNNECEHSLQWAEHSKDNVGKYAVDYDKLFVQTLGTVVWEEQPDIPYRSGSPSNGISEYGNPEERTRGDNHYWEVWHLKKPFREYLNVRPRFCSEFGFQSFSSVDTLLTCISQEDLNVTSPTMEHRQRHPEGNRLILHYMTEEYRIPLRFEDFVYVSQVQQGLAIKTASEHWRRMKPQNMGVIYWQLNDIWPAVSWSSLEYDGRWKVLHYMAKRFFNPLLISAYEEDGSLSVWVTSDLNEPIKSRARIQLRNFDGKPLLSKSVAYSLPSLGSKEIARIPLASMLGKQTVLPLSKEESEGVSARSLHELFLTMETSFGKHRSKNWGFLAPTKRCPLPEPTIKTSMNVKEDSIEIEVSTDHCAFFVWLSFGMTPGMFSDNALLLLPGEKRTVVFKPFHEVDLQELQKSLSVISLRDTY